MESALTIANPATPTERSNRDSLLTASLRDSGITWDYASEYPLVLSGTGDQTSWCVFEGTNIVAHANLWIRDLTRLADQKSIQIGLIGNVATGAEHRGRGIMSSLMSHLEKTAQSQNLKALVLWSDLLEFYQTLGFTSIGRELRFRISRDDRRRSTGITAVSRDSLSDDDLVTMLKHRPRMDWTLERAADEFRALLGIPDTNLFIRRKGLRIQSWMLIGKGADMRGIIHEWGSLSADELMADVQSILHTHDIPELTLLTPGNLHHHWVSPLKLRSNGYTEHPMALGKSIGIHGGEAIQALARGFIWGLDSI